MLCADKYSISLTEANLKVFTRWYLVPTILALMFPSSSPFCFRDCQAQGSMIHIWLECPRIRGFWNKLFNLIRKITDLSIPKSPQIALLNGHIPNIPKHSGKLIYFMLTGARIVIARAWKQPSVSLSAAKRKIFWIMSQEKLVSSLSKSFEVTWEPWARHVGISLIPGISI